MGVKNYKDVARQILVFHDLAQHLLHVGASNFKLRALFLGRLEADFVEHALHDGVQAAGSDVFRCLR